MKLTHLNVGGKTADVGGFFNAYGKSEEVLCLFLTNWHQVGKIVESFRRSR